MNYAINKKSYKKPLNKKLLALTLVLLLLGGLAFAGIKLKNSNVNVAEKSPAQVETEIGQKQTDTKEAQPSLPSKNSVTDGDTKAPDTNTGSTTDSPGNVTPVITYFNYSDDTKLSLEVDSFVPNIYESGTCTLLLTRGSNTISKTSAAYPNATTTSCNNFLVPRSEFPSSGEWSAVVKYSSPAHTGQSKISKFTI